MITQKALFLLVRVSRGFYHVCLCVEHLADELLGLHSAVLYIESRT